MAVSKKADTDLPFPIIADDKRELSVLLGMLDPDEKDKDGMPLTARCVRNPFTFLFSSINKTKTKNSTIIVKEQTTIRCIFLFCNKICTDLHACEMFWLYTCCFNYPPYLVVNT